MKNNDLIKILLLSFGLTQPVMASVEEATDADPAEIAIGERLFLETRFAQAYYATPNKADPVMDKTITASQALPGPFAGKTINCRACHMVDEHAENPLGGMRTYADYAVRPPVPARNDGAKTSGRNSMSMVNVSISRQHGTVFHYDGEFNSMEDLVRATLSGRNYGWQPHEQAIAFKHIASIVRHDDGKDKLAQEFGGSYQKILQASDKTIPAEFILPAEYRIDVNKASDKQIVDAVAKLISAYVTDLAFSRNDNDEYNASPYDAFLKLNNLPRKENKNESLTAYNQRLLAAINNLKNPKFVKASEQKFASHKQTFVFAEKELQGLKLFFKNDKGNCASCHAAPHFSDFGFHNTGLTQNNYDALHGAGSYNQLAIPSLAERSKNHNAYLPATAKHPAAKSPFRTIAAKDKPGKTDLGLWNVYANPDMPAPQQKLREILCTQAKQTGKQCDNESLLTSSIAAFKTPVLRDLGHSNPYMHTGQFADLAQAVRFYINSSALAKAKQLRNADTHIANINITEQDVAPMVAFLQSLNEDYE